MIVLLLLVLAFIALAMATFGLSPFRRVSMLALGLLLWEATELVGHVTIG